MELTGKAKEDFDNWYMNKRATRHAKLRREKVPSISMFYHLLDYSMQWGVYVDFFDNVDIELDYLFSNCLYALLTENNGEGKVKDFRRQAQIAAIEKANEIYNQKP